MKPQAVVFDIGNVLIGWQPEQVFDHWIGRARREALFAGVDLHGANERVDRGENFYHVMAEVIDANPVFSDELIMWRDGWLDLTGPVIARSVRVLRALRTKGVPVFALSNFGIETFEWAEERYGFLTEFDRRYISGHMKMAKPDGQIYEMVEADCGIAPEALLFADDRPENTAAAQVRGWQAHLFDGAAGWAHCLVEHGLLSEEEAR